MVAMTVALYKAEDCGDDLPKALGMAATWTHCVIAGVPHPIYVEAVEVTPEGWVQYTVDITVELTNYVLEAISSEDDMVYSAFGVPGELPDVLLHIPAAPDRAAVFPIPLDVVTPNCPLCGAPGMMVSSVQAACGYDRCAMFLWDVTKPRELLLADTAELKMKQNSLDPESESP